MDSMHSLLRRQLKLHLGDTAGVPAQWQAFVDGVNDAYHAFDDDRAMLERSLDLSSQELVDANSEMRAVFQAIPDLVLRINHRCIVLDVKTGLAGNLVIAREDFISKEIENTPLKDVARQLAAAVQRVFAKDSAVSFDYSSVLQGRECHFEARLVPLQEDQFVVIIRDITDRKDADRRVQKDLQTLKRAAEGAQAITQHQALEALLQEVADQARAVVQAHQCFVRLCWTGDSPQPAHGVSLSDKYANWRDATAKPGDGSADADTLIARSELPARMTQADMHANSRWSATATQAQGRPPLRGLLVTALKNSNGETVGFLELSDKYHGDFTIHDQYVIEELTHIASTALQNVGLIEKIRQFNSVLEQRVTDRTEALARQEALFHAAADQAPQVMWILDNRGAVTYLNRSWYELVGGAPPKWHGREWADTVMPDDVAEMRQKWAAVSKSGGVLAGTRRVRASDGTLHTLSYRASPVLDTHGEITCWIGMDADITEIKAIEGALRLSNRELEAFSYSVSHDLRAPLSAIAGFSQVLGEKLATNDTAKLPHYLTRIRASVETMSQLIESLLGLARISHEELTPMAVNMSKIADAVLAQLRDRNPERQVSVTVERDLVTTGDPGLLTIAIENLLNNAWKFTSLREDAGISFGLCAQDGPEPVYFVSDNGAGFDMAYADKLFGTFQRLHSTHEFPGTGVGLATVRRVIDRHEGRVWAESNPGKGTTFFFTLYSAA